LFARAQLTHYYDALEMFDKLAASARGSGMARDLTRDLAKTLNNLAAVLHQLRKFDEANAVYQRALAIKKRSDGEQHFSVGHTLYNMACLHMDHGKLGEGAELLQQSLEIYELAFGADHQLTIDVEMQLLGLLHTLKQQTSEDADGWEAHGITDLADSQSPRSPTGTAPGEIGTAKLWPPESHLKAERAQQRASSEPLPDAHSPLSPVAAAKAKKNITARKSSLSLSHARIARQSMPTINLGSRI
jgi:tetratricopeptide (TPR) repeat protein